MIDTFHLPQDSKRELGYFYTETEQGMLFHLCTAFHQAGDTIPTKFDATIQAHWAGLLRAYAEALHIDLGDVQPDWYLVAM